MVSSGVSRGTRGVCHWSLKLLSRGYVRFLDAFKHVNRNLFLTLHGLWDAADDVARVKQVIERLRDFRDDCEICNCFLQTRQERLFKHSTSSAGFCTSFFGFEFKILPNLENNSFSYKCIGIYEMKSEV